MRWFNRFKPLLDSYYASYKTNTCYWTGLLLLVRCALYIIFSFNSIGNTHKSLLAIITTFTAAGFAVGFVYGGRIYKNLSVNILEASVYLNLVILSAVTLVGVDHTAVLVYSLLGIIAATTSVVIAYHIHLQCIAKSAIFLKLKATITSRVFNRKVPPDTSAQKANRSTSSHDTHKIVSKTVIELREPFLDSD